MVPGINSSNPAALPNRIAHYRIVRKLGQGGMSIVYEGIDERLKRSVAVKILHPFLAERSEYRSRFLREAEAVARLTHPNIVQIFDVANAESEQLYIVTELLTGKTLKDFATENNFFDTPELSAMIIWEIAGALEHAHKRGIIHRDIKPENVMICRDGQLKLMDFGIASVGSEESLTQAGTLLGSLAHVAPEVIKGEKASFASDIFSLATVFYWLLANELPFNGDSPHALLKAIVDNSAKPIQTVSPFVSDDIAAIVDRGMQKKPGARFSTGAAMSEAIENALARFGIAIDTKQFHLALQNPNEQLAPFKDSVTESMKKKLLDLQHSKDKMGALMVECRLAALPPVRRTKRPYVFAMSALLIALAAAALLWLWPLPDEQIAHAEESPPLPKEVVMNVMPEESLITLIGDHEPDLPAAESPPKTEASNSIIRTVEIVVWPFANISLNGHLIVSDSKSVTLKLEAGEHKLTFTHRYAATVEKIVKITQNGPPVTLHIALKKSKPAFLIVRANVDVDIAVDGNYRGTAKKSQGRPIVIPMPDKSHAQKKEIIVSQDHYVPQVLEAEFVAGEIKEINVQLSPLKAR